MLALQRHKSIEEIVNRDGSATVAQLAEILGISVLTVRKDLQELAARGVLTKTRGGAVRRSTADSVPDIRHYAEKRRIARAAASLVLDGETLAIDFGTTLWALAEALQGRRLRIITPDIHIAYTLKDDPTSEIMLVGGVLRPARCYLGGALAEANLRANTADKAFVSASGLSVEGGLTDPYRDSADLKQALLGMARTAYLLADHHKLGQTLLAQVAPLRNFAALLVDDGVKGEDVQAFREAGIDVYVCAESGFDHQPAIFGNQRQ